MAYATDRSAAIAAARMAAERSVEIDPLNPYGNFAMGRVSFLEGRPDDGMPWLDRSVQLSPSYAKGHYSRAMLHMVEGRAAETWAGVDLAEQLSPLDPFLSPMRSFRAWSRVMAGDMEGAVPWAELSARTSQGHFIIVMAAAAILRMAGRGDRADHWTQVVREMRPDAAVGMYLRAVPHQSPDLRAAITAALVAQGFPVDSG
jgi:hypothetical protein